MSSSATASVSDETRYYRIGEVSRSTALKPFVLRYWETEFPMLQPVKSANGHRLYRQEDVDLVLKIKRLLYDEGFTIAGAQATPEGNGERQCRYGRWWSARFRFGRRADNAIKPENAAGFAGWTAQFLDAAGKQVIALDLQSGRSAAW